MSKSSDPGRHAATLSAILGAIDDAIEEDRRQYRQCLHEAESAIGRAGHAATLAGDGYSDGVVEEWGKAADAHKRAEAIIAAMQERMAEARKVRAERRAAEEAQRKIAAAEAAKREEAEAEAERQRAERQRAERAAKRRDAAEAEEARRAALTPAERKAEARLAELRGGAA